MNFLVQDFPVLAAGLLASVACAMIGSFLVLRKMSLMGDAISHAVLPGIVIAFLATKSLDALPVFVGAALIGVVTASLTEIIHRMGRVESGASMGVVFTVLFALGVLMLARIEHDVARGVHLDADCVLYGAMENVLWTSAPQSWNGIFTRGAWSEFPRQITTLVIALAIDVAFVTLLFKELRIAAFDPGLAKAQGVNPSVMHYLLMTLVAMTTVAAFEAVGSILVVAMLIVPGMCARLLSDRLAVMLWLSALLAAIAAGAGYAVSARLNVNAAGMIGVTLGVMLAIISLFAPRYGWIAQRRQATIATTPP